MGFKIFSKPANPEEVYYNEFEVPCFIEKEDPKIIKKIEIGDKAIDDKNNVIGEITWKGKAEAHEYLVNMGSNVKQRIKDPFKQNLSVAIKARFEIKNGYAYFNNQLIALGKNFKFQTDKYTISLIPTEKKRKWLSVKIRFSSLSPEASDIINQGYLEKDSDGTVIGKLREIDLNENSGFSFLGSQKSSFILSNQQKRYDVVAILYLLCTQEEDGLYFKNFPVKIGSQINFSTNRYSAFAVVIDIIDENINR